MLETLEQTTPRLELKNPKLLELPLCRVGENSQSLPHTEAVKVGEWLPITLLLVHLLSLRVFMSR